MDNYCPSSHEVKYNSNSIINFNDLEIENGKILQLLEKINEHNDYNNDIINNIIIIKNYDSYFKNYH